MIIPLFLVLVLVFPSCGLFLGKFFQQKKKPKKPQSAGKGQEQTKAEGRGRTLMLFGNTEYLGAPPNPPRSSAGWRDRMGAAAWERRLEAEQRFGGNGDAKLQHLLPGRIVF